jgi:hypothetical protein
VHADEEKKIQTYSPEPYFYRRQCSFYFYFYFYLYLSQCYLDGQEEEK